MKRSTSSNPSKDWMVLLNSKWIGYARANSREEAIRKVQEKRGLSPEAGRWDAQ